MRDALWMSLKAASGATAIALVLGTLAAYAVARYRFFGRETISFLVILPLALPGIVTGMALNATFREALAPFGVELGLFTIIVGHATFCIVVIYNNVVARLRRTARSFEEASADLGADTWQTFRFITFPQMRSALIAGGAARLRPDLRRGDRDDVHRRRRSRRCRSGSSTTCRAPTSCRSSTSSASASCCSRSSPSTSPNA